MIRRIAGALFVLCSFVLPLAAQPLLKSAIQVDPGNTKLTGATFGYRLTYNCSSTAGPCLGAEVIDLLPAEVVFDSTVPASPTGDVFAIQVTNNFMGSGRTRVRFDMIDPLPAGNSGDLIINVHFPNGSTADGTVATNTADGINLETAPGTFTTPPVNVTAVAAEQVTLTKTVTTLPLNLDLPETYRLRISNSSANGTLRIDAIGPVVDTLPPGTVFNGATPAADCQPGCVGTTPATVTWTSPCSTPLNPGGNCDLFVNVTFPSGTFPSGTSVTNSFTADGTPLGEPPQNFGVGSDTRPVTTFVPAPGARFEKNMLGGTPNPPTLNQTFSYEMIVENNGNVALDTMVVTDTVPVEFDTASVTTGIYSGFADFGAGVGVRVSYEKNTAPAVFTLWGASPDTATNTTLTSPPPGLAVGEYITRIRWEYGQAQPGASATTRPRITGQIVNPDHAGGPVAFGDAISNCADLTAVYTPGPTNVNRNDCASFTLSGPFVQLNPAKDNLSGGGPFNPGQNVSFRLRVRSAAQSSDPVPLEDLIVTDLLPVDLLFSSWTFDDQATGLPAPQNFSQIPNFAGTGRTLLRWTWNAGSGSLGVNQQVWINIATTVRNGALFGSLSNDMLIDSDAPGLALRCSGSSQADALDYDGDADTAETLCRATGSINVAGIAQLVSSKTIKGTCDGGAVSSSAGTLIGGGIEYHLRVQNVGTVPMQNFVLIDILPFVGDTGVRDTNPRGSEWTPLLAAPIVPPSGTTLYYATSGNPCRGEVGGPTTGCDPPNWTTVAPSPITSARSFKLEFGDRVVNPFDFVEFTFVMTTPGDVPPGDVAYNSFAYQADRADGLGSLAAEPVKVGISLGACDAASLGDYVWVDTNGDGNQNDGPTGLNGVYVQLFTPGPDGFPGTLDDVPLASTVTSNSPSSAPGWYSFPGLAPGDYFVKITPPPSYEISPRDAAGDATDSDSDPNGASHVTNLSSNEDDPTIDFGLVPAAFGAAGNYVWFDANSDGIQNEPVTSGINGVTVHLFIDDGDDNREPGGDDLLVATTVTADDVYARPGYYLFDGLVPGLPYFIQFITPASATARTTSNAGGDDTVDSDPDANGTTPVFRVAALELNPTFDAGFIAPAGTLALGDQVWLDADNDGIYEPENGEAGIDDVRLDLYRDANGDGEPSLDEFAASAVTATTSGFAGRYRFDDLAPGAYIVVVAPVSFTGGGALAGLSTSTGNDPAPDPDDDANGDDNGTNLGALIASRPVTLTDNGEPTSEDGNNDTNLTVDFGFIAGGDPPDYDYGDAPDVGVGTAAQDYQTTALDSGPRHLLGVPGAPFLGACVDADGGFLQNLAANADDTIGSCNDDEDGVTFTGSLTPSGTATFNVTAGAAPCSLDAWVDWNQDGDFTDAGEQIATSLSVPPGPATVLSPSVPAGAIPGTTYARFRCSSGGGLTPTGEAADGEVEDYAITIIGSDFGDAPASYGAAEHRVDPLTPLYLGTCVDTEPASQPSTGAIDDDDNPGTSRVGSCFDDESGVVQQEPLLTCETADFNIVSSAAGLLDAWLDFNGNGVFTDPGEQVFTGNALVAGANARTIAVPCTAVPGIRYGRFRVSSAGGQTPTSVASDGEVEDYAFNISGTDFGDAPDSYGTLVASNGARHLVQTGFSLGVGVDAEPDGQPSAGANGDGADEDGVTLPALNACASAGYTVVLTNSAALNAPRLDAWVDFDGDGAFQDPRDRIAAGVVLAIGANNLNAAIPCDVRTRSTYARFRLSDGGIATPTGLSIPGEVEDYVATLQGYDYGDAPAPHPVLAAGNGARHIVLLSGNPTLGATTDTEDDGQPSAGANGDGADEDGVTSGTLTAAATNSITITTGATGGNVSCWIDFDNDGNWTDAGEQIVTDLAIGASSSSSPGFPVPANAVRGTLALRCRISTLTGLASTGSAANGEIEDHLVAVTGYDLGDAPAPYATLVANSGARHQLLAANNPTLGPTVDADADGQPSAGFNGDDLALTDDEDGVAFPGVLLPSTTGSIALTTGATGGLVSCWIDFDGDGDWTDAGEQVVANLPIAANGSASPTFAVPPGAVNGTTGVRCRIATLGTVSPTGDAPDGEIEDHAVIIGAVDFGDAPDTYGTTLAGDGPRHGVVTGFAIGAAIDSEANGQPSVSADGDGADEDGVSLPATLVACSSTSVTVALTNTAAIATPLLDAWIDFNGNGVFDAGDRIATGFALAAGVNNVPVNVPCSAGTAVSYARFRLSSTGAGAPTGPASDGEVEDYVVHLNGLDFGDHADPAYPTLLASNGARHVVVSGNNPTLGVSVDTEANGAPGAAATGDDTAGTDDENGVTFGPIIPGAMGSITVTTGATGGNVSVWIDFDHNGSWADAGEHVVADQPLAGGASQQFTFPVPAGAIAGSSPLRARISSQTGLGVTGLANDGEIEDHLAPVLAAEPRIGAALEEESRTPAGQCGSNDFVFVLRVQNLGNVSLTNVQATLPLASVFVAPATYSVTSVTSAELTVDPSYDGGAQSNLLLAGATLDAGESATIRVAFRLNAGCRDVTYQLSATVTGQAPDSSTVTDTSQNGSDTDPDDDGSATDDNEPTPIAIVAFIDVPTLDVWALIAIAALLAVLALRRI